MKSLEDYRAEATKALTAVGVDPTPAEVKQQVEYMIWVDRQMLVNSETFHIAHATGAHTEPYRSFHANRVVVVSAELGNLDNVAQENV